MHGYGNTPSSEFDISYKRYNPKMEKKKSTRRQIERSSEPMYRKYRASFLNQGEGVTSLKKCRSSEKFEGLQEHSPSRGNYLICLLTT